MAECPLAARQAQPTVVLGGLAAFSPVTDGVNFYWGDPGTAANSYEDGRILFVPVTGGTPTVLVDHTTWPSTLATDGVNVYWGDTAGNVKRCATAGCGDAPSGMATLQPDLNGMTTDGTSVYWGMQNGVMECAVGGCGAGPTLLTSDTNAVFATNGQTLFLSQNATISACSVTGCNQSPTIIAISPNGVMSGMVATSSELWWFGTAALSSCMLGACASSQTVLTPIDRFGYGLTTPGFTATDVLWSMPGDPGPGYLNLNMVWRCSRSGCDGSPTEVAAVAQTTTPGMSYGFGAVTPPLVRSQEIYWLRGMTSQGTSYLNDGAIMKCPVCGCNGAPRELVQATGPNGSVPPMNLAVSGDHAVWFDGTGNLMACSISNCNATAMPIAQGLPNGGNAPTVQLATDGIAAYWVSTVVPIPEQATTTLFSCPLSGCGPSPTALASNLATPATGIAVDADYIYWISLGLRDAQDGGSAGDGVIRFPKAGGATEVVAGGNFGGPSSGSGSAGADGAVAVDTQYLYWANTYTGAIQRLPLAGAS